MSYCHFLEILRPNGSREPVLATAIQSFYEDEVAGIPVVRVCLVGGAERIAAGDTMASFKERWIGAMGGIHRHTHEFPEHLRPTQAVLSRLSEAAAPPAPLLDIPGSPSVADAIELAKQAGPIKIENDMPGPADVRQRAKGGGRK